MASCKKKDIPFVHQITFSIILWIFLAKIVNSKILEFIKIPYLNNLVGSLTISFYLAPKLIAYLNISNIFNFLFHNIFFTGLSNIRLNHVSLWLSQPG